ncbi:hypothetical protein J1614_001370 [Plenodomus biglobosus]|nr:hypothetical protein J1614_001370 [Plenodomus biglobosus]
MESAAAISMAFTASLEDWRVSLVGEDLDMETWGAMIHRNTLGIDGDIAIPMMIVLRVYSEKANRNRYGCDYSKQIKY